MISKIIAFFRRKFGAKPERIRLTINPFDYADSEGFADLIAQLIPKSNSK